MERRGQFFLAATFVIIGILLGLTSIANFVVVKGDREYFYDLASEVGFETKKVIDYGIYENLPVMDLTKDFLSNYSDYIGQDQVIFIYGKEPNLEGLFFEEDSIGTVGLSTGGAPTTVPIQRTTGRSAQVTVVDGIVNVNINGTIHQFEVRDGMNLFYVIIKEDGDEVLVAEG